MAYFSIEPEGGKREDFEAYRYRILRDGEPVAKYWIDFRGDDHGIEFIDGSSFGWPVGSVLEFVQGGGSSPIRLTPEAVAFLEEKSPAPTLRGEQAAAVAKEFEAAIATTARPGRNRRLVVALALLSWLACLFLPPLQIEHRDSSGWGLSYLLTGWMGPLAMHFEWFANPLFFVAAFALWRGHAKTAFVCALLACFCVMLLPMRGSIYADEGGHRATILAFRLGYWLWFAAPALVLVSAMANLRPTPPPLPARHGKA